MKVIEVYRQTDTWHEGGQKKEAEGLALPFHLLIKDMLYWHECLVNNIAKAIDNGYNIFN